MRFLERDNERLVFRLSAGEKVVFQEVLECYPRVPPAHHHLSRGPAGEADAERQRLLDEALAEQRARNKRHLQAWLKRPGTFRRAEDYWRFTVRCGDLEWLMQVLNDIRVGSWIALGSPEELPRRLSLDEASAPLVAVMEIAGLMQMALLEAAEGEGT